jgi:hypothetical protein
MMNRLTAIVALSFALAAGAAVAQAPAPAPEQGGGRGQWDPAKRDAMLEERFKAADKDGDGKLTKDEAEAGMPRVAKHFDEIDKDHKGYVTLDQIKAAMAAMRGTH